MDNSVQPTDYFKNLKVKSTHRVSQHISLPVTKITQMIEQGTLQINQSSLQLPPKPQPPISSPDLPPIIPSSQRVAFVQAVSKQRKLIQKRRQKRLETEQQKLKQMLQAEAQQHQLIKQQQQVKRKQELQQRLEELRQKIKQKQESYKQQNRELGRVLNSKTLHEKIEEKYQLLEASSLEEKKQRLAEIRKLHQPVTKEEIASHQRFIEELREKVNSDRMNNSQVLDSQIKHKIYKSIWYRQVSEVQVEPEAANVRSRIKCYEDHVKTNFKPQVSSKPKQEESQDIKVSPKRKALDSKERKQKGLQYLKFVKQNHPSVPKRTRTQQTIKKPPDYLHCFQRKRQQMSGSQTQKHTTQLSVLKQLTNVSINKLDKTKVEKLLDSVWKAQNKAKSSLTSAQLGDQLITASIQAKLTLLQ